MSGRLAWTQTSEEWRSGRYRIQLIAPGMWALMEEGTDRESSVVMPVLVTTSASLKSLKRVAEQRERRRRRNHRMWKHTVGMIGAVSGLVLAASLPPAWMVLVTVPLILVALRSLAVVIDTVTDAPWARVRQTYQ